MLVQSRIGYGDLTEVNESGLPTQVLKQSKSFEAEESVCCQARVTVGTILVVVVVVEHMLVLVVVVVVEHILVLVAVVVVEHVLVLVVVVVVEHTLIQVVVVVVHILVLVKAAAAAVECMILSTAKKRSELTIIIISYYCH